MDILPEGRAERRLQILSSQLKPSKLNLQNCTVLTPNTKPSFRYTLVNNLLSFEQREFYEKNGFLVIRNLVPKPLLEKYRERFLEICHNKDIRGQMTVMKDVSLKDKTDVDPERVINKLQEFQFDPILSEYIRLPQILRVVECFTDKDISATHTMLINKPPDSGTKTSRHPMHQDLHYFPFRPADRIVCSWTAMQPVFRENGCLSVVPGTHTGELLPHGYPDWKDGYNSMYYGIKEFNDFDKLVYLEMGPGDTVFFHPLLIHGSGQNKTKNFRKAISCHFTTTHCDFFDVAGTTQEHFKKEIQTIIDRKFPGMELGLTDAYKLKQVVVQGEPRKD